MTVPYECSPVECLRQVGKLASSAGLDVFVQAAETLSPFLGLIPGSLTCEGEENERRIANTKKRKEVTS